ncbi:MAG: hypothetical protein OEQ53_18715, partial [Saprospiraceae bacterium]|nr:hypothetical protein [Saprospiraceae bacterium]
MHYLLKILFAMFILMPELSFAQEMNGWKFHSQREAIAPSHSIVENNGQSYFVLAGNGKEFISGGWVKQFAVAGGTVNEFSVKVNYYKTEQPYRSIIATIVWLDQNNKQIGPKEFPTGRQGEKDAEFYFQQIYRVPSAAVRAEVAL